MLLYKNCAAISLFICDTKQMLTGRKPTHAFLISLDLLFKSPQLLKRHTPGQHTELDLL